MEFTEVSAKTVDEAITKACIELGLSSDRLDIQIVSEGSAGFLGFGSKPAVIKVREKEDPEAAAARAEKAKEKAENAFKEEAADTAEKAASGNSAKSAQDKKKRKKQETRKEEPVRTEQKEAPAQTQRVVTPKTDEEIAAMKETAVNFLRSVFDAMEFDVTITTSYDQEEGCLEAVFEGQDMGVLIGKRGQTLDSLQYLTSLVVNKDQKEYIRVKLDTEDYRRRRKETLENLAKNIAGKVKRTRRAVSLEAMNPYERRIIHSALQDNRYVETYSEGNEPYRHIVVAPKR